MSSIQAMGISGKSVQISSEDLQALSASLRGKVILPSTPEYDETRRIWNATIDKRPAFIVACKGTADVMAALRFAHAHALQLSVRGAGHNIAGRSLENQVVLIDLSGMRQVHVDPDARVAYVSPGATLADVDHETHPFNLAVPVGINSTTGISGLTLGGGFGWLSRQYGMTIDNLRAAEVVTVDGNRLYCSDQNHPDLFWGIRGGGGNFGVVTQYEFSLHPVEAEVVAGPIVFDAREAKAVLQKYRAFCQGAPNNLTTWCVMRKAPPLPFLDAKHHGQPSLIVVPCFNGPKAEGQKLIAQILAFGTPLGNGAGPCPFPAFQQAFDPLLTPGARNYWKTHNFKDLKDDLFDKLVAATAALPSDETEIFLAQMGGKTNEVHPDATAYPHRDINFIINVHTRWRDQNDDAKCIQWGRKLYQETLPFATGGSYVNFVSQGDDNIGQSYGPNEERLATLKAKYDPNNALRSNLNILPR